MFLNVLLIAGAITTYIVCFILVQIFNHGKNPSSNHTTQILAC